MSESNGERTVGTYEQGCIDYALHGNPERDHWDHEENAHYDRWDGHRDADPGGYEADYQYELQVALEDRKSLRDSMTDADYIDPRDARGV